MYISLRFHHETVEDAEYNRSNNGPKDTSFNGRLISIASNPQVLVQGFKTLGHVSRLNLRRR